jgi:4-hydroxy-tetrahydrodipicolinate reductase
MDERIKVVVLGTGQMGAGMIRLLQSKPALQLVGVFGRRGHQRPVDAGIAAGLGCELGFDVRGDLAALLEDTTPDIALQATCSKVVDAEPELRVLLERGVNVISIAEEMAFPAYAHPQLAASLDDLARSRGATLLGTGINPGFVLDLLIVALSGTCQRIDRIEARRINDLAPYGPTVLACQGVGLTTAQFEEGVLSGRVAGHLGFPESLAMIASALGWQIERIEQRREPIISDVRRQTPHVVVEPGCVAGCMQTAIAWVDGRAAIQLTHPQQIHPRLGGIETGDYIDIEGEPGLHLSIEPEIAGGTATVALAVNVIPRALQAEPGLRTMIELPVAAMLSGSSLRLPATREGGAAGE